MSAMNLRNIGTDPVRKKKHMKMPIKPIPESKTLRPKLKTVPWVKFRSAPIVRSKQIGPESTRMSSRMVMRRASDSMALLSRIEF